MMVSRIKWGDHQKPNPTYVKIPVGISLEGSIT